MYKLLPDIYKKNIYSIDYISLKNAGIKVILFDLENTLASVDEDRPDNQLKQLMEALKSIDLSPVIISNAGKRRIRPFKEDLTLNAAFLSFKPLKFKYKKIMKIYKVKPDQMASIGDQMLTDVLGANRMGITSILVNPVDDYDKGLTKVNRVVEKIVISYYRKRGIFDRGEYYE